MQQPIMETLRWLRMIGDMVFIIGVGALAWFVLGLKTGWSYAGKPEDSKPLEAALSSRFEELPSQQSARLIGAGGIIEAHTDG